MSPIETFFETFVFDFGVNNFLSLLIKFLRFKFLLVNLAVSVQSHRILSLVACHNIFLAWNDTALISFDASAFRISCDKHFNRIGWKSFGDDDD